MIMANLSLSIVEIAVLMLGAVTLGITIHFFLVSRKSMQGSPMETEKITKTLEDWKLRYFNDTELRDRELASLRQRLEETEENNNINSIEAEEMRKLNKKLKAELEQLRNSPAVQAAPAAAASSAAAAKGAPDYIQQLKLAQQSLRDHNEKINTLLGQIDIVKETEEKQLEITRLNHELANEVEQLRVRLSEQEQELSATRQKEQITHEMSSMIDSAYNEFNVLQEKIQKLESQVMASRKINLQYEDLQEEHIRITEEYEDQKKKFNAISAENKHLLEELTETEDKLKEANIQRQQLQKKVAYLEELNNDLQFVADANKKLESQLKRVAELESMLNVISEERDLLAKKAG